MLEHNEITTKQAEEYIADGKRVCIVNPCGSGKSMIMSAILNKHKDKSFCIFTKQKNAKGYYESLESRFKDVKIVTYSKMLKDSIAGDTNDYKADFYLADEAHYIGAPKWGQAFSALCDKYNPLVIGFTATPQRFEHQGTDETIVTSFFEGNSAGNFTTMDLQKRGIFTEPEYIVSLYDLDKEIDERLEKLEDVEISNKEKEHIRERLYRVYENWQKNSSPEVVLRNKLPNYMYKENSNRMLVYVSSVAEIENAATTINGIVQNLFGKQVMSYRYTYKDKENVLKEFLKDEDCYIKILYTVDKIMETVHIDDLSIVLMLRPSVSNRIITQQFGRINSIGNKNKALVIDMVGNLSNLNTYIPARDNEGPTRNKKDGDEKGKTITADIRYINPYISIFEQIDRVFSRSRTYSYKGYIGSLYNISRVFGKDYHELKDLIIRQKKTIEEAMTFANNRVPKDIPERCFDEVINYKPFMLNAWQKKIAEEQIDTVNRFCRRKHIEDEDLIQILNYEMMHKVSQVEDKNLPKSIMTQKVSNAISEKYTEFFRIRIQHNQLFTKEGLDQIENKSDGSDVADYCAERFLKETLTQKVLPTLRDRERAIIFDRFGLLDGKAKTLNEVAKPFHVTGNRIREIEAMALRKLRHPSRANLLKDYLDETTCTGYKRIA